VSEDARRLQEGSGPRDAYHITILSRWPPEAEINIDGALLGK